MSRHVFLSNRSTFGLTPINLQSYTTPKKETNKNLFVIAFELCDLRVRSEKTSASNMFV